MAREQRGLRLSIPSARDLILGCTGRNFLPVEQLRKVKPNHEIHFVSCSSRDVEFLDLLRFGQINPSTIGDGFGRLDVTFRGTHRHFIENGGFPINFDRFEEQEGPNEIALTRALVLAGIFQALCVKVKERREDLLMLSPSLQRALVQQWLHLTGKSAADFGIGADIDSLDWWKTHSSGECPVPKPGVSDSQMQSIGRPVETASHSKHLVRQRPALIGSV
jgi:hypothetical protein